MSWLFGKGKKKPEAPKAEDCSESIGKTLEDLRKKEEFLEKKVNDETLKAKAFVKANNKKKAAECLKRRKILQIQQDKISAMSNNLLTQQDQIQQAALNAQVFAQYRQTNDAIKSQFKAANLDADKIDEIIDDMDETQSTMEEISNALTRPMGPQIDEDELDEDMANLMAEMEDEEQEEEVVAPSPAKKQKVAMTETAAADDDEINGLMASFS